MTRYFPASVTLEQCYFENNITTVVGISAFAREGNN